MLKADMFKGPYSLPNSTLFSLGFQKRHIIKQVFYIFRHERIGDFYGAYGESNPSVVEARGNVVIAPPAVTRITKRV